MNVPRFSIPLLLGKIRRFLIMRLRPNTIAQRMALRQGGCNRCAICCQLLYRCPMLSKDNLCMIYESPLRPSVCQHFPFDNRDLDDVARMGSDIGCGYAFVRVSEGHIPLELTGPQTCPSANTSLGEL